MAADERMVNASGAPCQVVARPPACCRCAADVDRAVAIVGAVSGGPDRITGPLLWLAVALTLLQTLPLVARSRWPLGVLAVTATAEALSSSSFR